MKVMICFPPSLVLSNIIHNLIFYSNQIYWVEFLYPGVGLRPPMVIPYGITVGADTIHPEFIHICWRHFVQNRNSVKVCLKHKIEFTIANCTCASRISPPSSVASWRCVFAIQRMGSHTGVTKVKNLLMYNLRFNGVHFHPSNAVLQMDAF
jgi:hypothetical protein